MNIRNISLAGAALLALSFGIGTAAADEQDDAVRQLNLEQLEKAKSGDTAPQTAPAPTQPDGVGGPEFTAPPAPDEGMTEEGADEAAPPPDSDAPDADEPEPEGEAEPN